MVPLRQMVIEIVTPDVGRLPICPVEEEGEPYHKAALKEAKKHGRGE